jgi:hypothetical protein
MKLAWGNVEMLDGGVHGVKLSKATRAQQRNFAFADLCAHFAIFAVMQFVLPQRTQSIAKIRKVIE